MATYSVSVVISGTSSVTCQRADSHVFCFQVLSRPEIIRFQTVTLTKWWNGRTSNFLAVPQSSTEASGISKQIRKERGSRYSARLNSVCSRMEANCQTLDAPTGYEPQIGVPTLCRNMTTYLPNVGTTMLSKLSAPLSVTSWVRPSSLKSLDAFLLDPVQGPDDAPSPTSLHPGRRQKLMTHLQRDLDSAYFIIRRRDSRPRTYLNLMSHG